MHLPTVAWLLTAPRDEPHLMPSFQPPELAEGLQRLGSPQPSLGSPGLHLWQTRDQVAASASWGETSGPGSAKAGGCRGPSPAGRSRHSLGLAARILPSCSGSEVSPRLRSLCSIDGRLNGQLYEPRCAVGDCQRKGSNSMRTLVCLKHSRYPPEHCLNRVG